MGRVPADWWSSELRQVRGTDWDSIRRLKEGSVTASVVALSHLLLARGAVPTDCIDCTRQIHRIGDIDARTCWR